MRITKFGHACVRIEHDGAALVLDPGMFTDAGATDGADAVLITHEHADHWSVEHLRATDAPVLTIAAVAAQIAEQAPDVAERVRVLAPGDDTTVAGFGLRAVGELHAVIHAELPRITNSGYVVSAGGERVYHPGDALTAPGEAVDVLLAPSSAPWLRSEMAIDFVREVGAPRNLSIHDAIYTEAGHHVLAAQMQQLVEPRGLAWIRRADGEDL